jgi:hypothetical protein
VPPSGPEGSGCKPGAQAGYYQEGRTREEHAGRPAEREPSPSAWILQVAQKSSGHPDQKSGNEAVDDVGLDLERVADQRIGTCAQCKGYDGLNPARKRIGQTVHDPEKASAGHQGDYSKRVIRYSRQLGDYALGPEEWNRSDLPVVEGCEKLLESARPNV